MSNKVSAEKLIALWIGEIGGQCPVDRQERIPALLDLLKKFVSCGYTEEEVSGQIKTKILDRAYNPNYHKPKERKRWKKMASEDIESAIAMTWPPDIPTEAPTPALQSVYHAPEKSQKKAEKEIEPGNGKLIDKSKFKSIEFDIMSPEEFLSDIGIDDE